MVTELVSLRRVIKPRPIDLTARKCLSRRAWTTRSRASIVGGMLRGSPRLAYTAAVRERNGRRCAHGKPAE